MSPMHKRDRHSQFSQLPIIKIDARARIKLRQLQPHPAISLDNRLPMLPMIGGKQAPKLLADFLRMMGIALKEIVRGGLAPVEVKRFKNKMFATVWRQEPNLRGDHRSIAVSPKHRPLDPERIQNKQRLFRGPPMKIDRSLPRQWQVRRLPIARPVRNHKTKPPSKFLDLPVYGINPISPPAMQEDYRRSAANISLGTRHGVTTSSTR